MRAKCNGRVQYFAKDAEELEEVIKNFSTDIGWIDGEDRDEWRPTPSKDQWPICLTADDGVLGFLDTIEDGDVCDGCPFAVEQEEF